MNIQVLMDELNYGGSNFCNKLKEIYGLEGLELQKKRYKTSLERFRELYPESREVCVSRAGGRLLISGEHLDYHHGWILNSALSEDTVVISSLGNRGFCFANMDSHFDSFKINSTDEVKIVVLINSEQIVST